MEIICLDMEGVIVPEIWVNFAEKTGIKELRLTTRDIKDYNELMDYRLKILNQHGYKIKDIQDVIATLKPFDGAKEFLDWIRERTQLVILSDTFSEFAKPLMVQLGMPTLFCHELEIADDGQITDYKLRMKDHKTHATRAFQSLNFDVFAAGDSYNDTGMLKQAQKGVLFRAPQNVKDEFSQFKTAETYEEMKDIISTFLER
ncbi:MAG: bifunctional phosphoserine phosphatase/homoserine phosphotransferase ThrH [Alphaproteobacteria bacterium]